MKERRKKEKKEVNAQAMQKIREEQEQEIEALKAIFQDDFLALTPPSTDPTTIEKFAIILEPTTERVSSHVAAKVEISFSPLYPHQAPTINVIKMKGLSDVCIKYTTLVQTLRSKNAGHVATIASAVTQKSNRVCR